MPDEMPDPFDDAGRDFQFHLEQQMAQAGRELALRLAEMIVDAVNVFSATLQAELRKRLAVAFPAPNEE